MARQIVVVLLALLASGCIKHCAYFNLLPAFGIAFNEPVCAGGQPAAPALEDILKTLKGSP